MKYGIREICDVVLKAKANNTEVGNAIFQEGQPVLYFDTLKTSSMEGAATTVYAQGGRGNSRLIAWEGERTVTFTMEDALISDLGLAVLTGAGLVDPTTDAPLKIHTTSKFGVKLNTEKTGFTDTSFTVDEVVSKDQMMWVMFMDKNDDILHTAKIDNLDQSTVLEVTNTSDKRKSVIKYAPSSSGTNGIKAEVLKNTAKLMFDFYVEKSSGARQIEITPDKFGGNYYLEASTLFRDQNGKDMPAEFIIPNCKVQSNFNFSLASTGDPSTFTFTMDAFPDYTVYDPTKKVLSVIQVIEDEAAPLADHGDYTPPKTTTT